MRRFNSVEQSSRFVCVCEIGVLGSGEKKGPAWDGFGLDNFADRAADQTGASRDEHDTSFLFENVFSTWDLFRVFK